MICALHVGIPHITKLHSCLIADRFGYVYVDQTNPDAPLPSLGLAMMDLVGSASALLLFYGKCV